MAVHGAPSSCSSRISFRATRFSVSLLRPLNTVAYVPCVTDRREKISILWETEVVQKRSVVLVLLKDPDFTLHHQNIAPKWFNLQNQTEMSLKSNIIMHYYNHKLHKPNNMTNYEHLVSGCLNFDVLIYCRDWLDTWSLMSTITYIVEKNRH